MALSILAASTRGDDEDSLLLSQTLLARFSGHPPPGGLEIDPENRGPEGRSLRRIPMHAPPN